jgi:hypothetical protein
MLTGAEHPGGKGNENIKASRTDFPCYSAIVKRFRRPLPGVPTSIVFPQPIFNVFEWPGQNAGFLGGEWDPWQLTCEWKTPSYRIDQLTTSPDVPLTRLTGRRTLLDRVAERGDRLPGGSAALRFRQQTTEAFDLLTGRRAQVAFDVSREPQAVRERYGAHPFGQGCLLARRLVEAGVSLVQLNWRRSRDGDADNENMWDLHKTLVSTLKTRLMPPMDQGYTALLEDLEQRGLLDETLVLWMGEMGRTPRYETLPDYPEPGRNHWGHVFSMALAGAGVRGGLVYGASDKIGGYPKDSPVTPADVTATLYHCLGIQPATLIHDRLNRPLPISTGRVVEALF